MMGSPYLIADCNIPVRLDSPLSAVNLTSNCRENQSAGFGQCIIQSVNA
jgi:hypothetical protein